MNKYSATDPASISEPAEDIVSGWTNACAVDDIEAEGVVRYDQGRRTFAIYRNHIDQYYCTDGLCTHENVHLAGGLVMDNTVECPKHSSIFDIVTGAVQTPPACGNLATYPTRVENGRVLIQI